MAGTFNFKQAMKRAFGHRLARSCLTLACLLMAPAPGAACCGDPNADGEVKTTDALEVLKEAVGIEGHCSVACCDMTGDAAIKVTDALVVLKTAVGIETDQTCRHNRTIPLSVPRCGDGALLSTAPLAASAFSSIVPLGNLNPSAHTFPTDHLYFYLTYDPDSGLTEVADVYSPADAWITQVSSSAHTSEDPPYTDYSLVLRPCKDYELWFGHLQSLSSELEAALAGSGECESYTTGGDDYTYCSYETELEVSAGQTIGTAGGRAGQAALDLGAKDWSRLVNSFANEERILANAPGLLHISCPLDAYDDTTRTMLEASLGAWDGSPRTEEPVCGTISHDIAGTAQGIWFAEAEADNFYPEDPHLALVPDNNDPSLSVISAGTSVPGLSYKVSFTPQESGTLNRDFADISNDGQTYCYTHDSGGAVLISMTGSSSLLVDYQAATDCSAGGFSLSSAAVAYIR